MLRAIFPLIIMSLTLTACVSQSTWTPPGPISTRPQVAADPTTPPVSPQVSSQTGKVAPAFTLTDHDGKSVRLADYRGQWLVIYFYAREDTPSCVCQSNEYTTLLTRFRDMGVTVVGISPDTAENHAMYREKYNLGITLLSDADHAVMRQYNAWQEINAGDKVTGLVIRSTYIINPQGHASHGIGPASSLAPTTSMYN